MLITGGGGLALLGGLILVAYGAGNVWTFTEVIANVDQLQSSPLFIPGLLCVYLGAATKSALFPFHFWLPGAMSAPTPVSAYLHSATMVKAGVFLLARMHPRPGRQPNLVLPADHRRFVDGAVGGVPHAAGQRPQGSAGLHHLDGTR